MEGAEPISAENCVEELLRARRSGSEEARQRVYRFMSDHLLEVLRSPGLFGRLGAGEREEVLARRTGGTRVLAVAESSEPPQRAGGPRSPLQERPGGPRRVWSLHPERRRWEVLTSLPEEVPARGSGMCTLYNYLFVAGGADGPRASDRVFCFNPPTRLWSPAAPLRQPRTQLRLVAMDGLLYAVGGECLFSVERYDPREARWAPVAPLPKGAFAVAHEATACGGALFVSGGSLFYRMLRYDSRRDEWEECPFNESRRRSTDMVAHRNLLYRFDVDRERAGVNVYKYNTVVKAWTGGSAFPLPDPRPFRCAVLGDRIYCVNRSQTLQLEVQEEQEEQEEQEGFLPELLPSPPETRGGLVPFVLCLDQDPRPDPTRDDGPEPTDPNRPEPTDPNRPEPT
ncbi:kelch repeat and BTB domain-containing protein 11-like [Centropristis striata]|uniref:kelch repeat and BTB domain-containing protein 11-like n=1 Tax=Centropristis striata TaxID=184440 RepID=UPI0027E15C8B|nr:kelch repeat and BTB domain-containing protein 11-like [Centropristis striata]